MNPLLLGIVLLLASVGCAVKSDGQNGANDYATPEITPPTNDDSRADDDVDSDVGDESPSSLGSEWAASFVGPKGMGPSAWVVLSDGSQVVAGGTQLANGDSQALLTKISSGGNVLWARSYGGDAVGEMVNQLRQTSDGNIVAFGNTRFWHAYDPWLFKVNASTGDVIWQKTLHAPAGRVLSVETDMISVDQSGSLLFHAPGLAYSDGTIKSQLAAIYSFSLDGNIVASRWITTTTINPYAIHTVLHDAEGNEYMEGRDIIVKYGPQKQLLWARTARGANWSADFDFMALCPESLIVWGFKHNANAYTLGMVSKADGTFQWLKASSGTSWVVKGATCNADTVFVVGRSSSGDRVWLAGYDFAGNERFQVSYGRSNYLVDGAGISIFPNDHLGIAASINSNLHWFLLTKNNGEILFNTETNATKILGDVALTNIATPFYETNVFDAGSLPNLILKDTNVIVGTESIIRTVDSP